MTARLYGIFIIFILVISNIVYAMDSLDSLKKENYDNCIVSYLGSNNSAIHKDGVDYLREKLNFLYAKNRNMPLADKNAFKEGVGVLGTFFSPAVDTKTIEQLHCHEAFLCDLQVREALLFNPVRNTSFVIRNAKYTNNYTAQLWVAQYLLTQISSPGNKQECVEYFKLLSIPDKEELYDQLLLHVAPLKKDSHHNDKLSFFEACNSGLYHKLKNVHERIAKIVLHETVKIDEALQSLALNVKSILYKPFIRSPINKKKVVATKLLMMLQGNEKMESITNLFAQNKEVIPFCVSWCAHMVQYPTWQEKIGNFFWNFIDVEILVKNNQDVKKRFFEAICADHDFKTKKFNDLLQLPLLCIKAELLGVNVDSDGYMRESPTLKQKIDDLEYAVSIINVKNLPLKLKKYHTVFHETLMKNRLFRGTCDENEKVLARAFDQGFDFGRLLFEEMQAGKITEKQINVKSYIQLINKNKHQISRHTAFYVGFSYLVGIENKLNADKDLAYSYFKQGACAGSVDSWELLLPLAYKTRAKETYEDLYECIEELYALYPNNQMFALQKDLLQLRFLGDIDYTLTKYDKKFLDKVQQQPIYISAQGKNNFVVKDFYLKAWAYIINNDVYNDELDKKIAAYIKLACTMNRAAEQKEGNFNVHMIVPPKVIAYCENSIKRSMKVDGDNAIKVSTIISSLLLLLEQYTLGLYDNKLVIKEGLDYCIAHNDDYESLLLNTIICWHSEINKTLCDKELASLDFIISDNSHSSSVLAASLSTDILYRKARSGSSRYALLLLLERNKDDLKTFFSSHDFDFLDVLSIDLENRNSNPLERNKWKKIKIDFLPDLCELADNKDNPVLSARVARFIVSYELLHESIDYDHADDEIKKSLGLIKKYGTDLVKYNQKKNEECVEKAQLCMRYAIESLVKIASCEAQGSLYKSIFDLLKNRSLHEAYEHICLIDKKKELNPIYYALKGSCIIHDGVNAEDSYIYFEQARQIQAQLAVGTQKWIAYIEPPIKQRLWDMAQEMISNKTELSQGDYGLIAYASLFNDKEKTPEQHIFLLESGAFKHSHVSLLYVLNQLKHISISISDLSKNVDWDARYIMYNALHFAALQKQRTLSLALFLDYATQKQALELLETAALDGDIGAAVTLATLFKKEDDIVHCIVSCPFKFNKQQEIFFDKDIEKIIDAKDANAVKDTIEQLMQKKSSLGFQAYFRLYFPRVFVSELQNGKQVYNIGMIEKILYCWAFYVSCASCAQEEKNCLKKYMQQLVIIGLKQDPTKSFLRVMLSKIT